MAKYMIIYSNEDGCTMAKFGDEINQLNNIEKDLFKSGVRLVQWYTLNDYNEYVCLSITRAG